MSANLLRQSKLESAIESFTNTAIGFGIALIVNGFCFWLFDLNATFFDNLGITLIMTLVSLVRGYVVRRWFNRRGK
jgi:dipeptide/tripeptide permease